MNRFLLLCLVAVFLVTNGWAADPEQSIGPEMAGVKVLDLATAQRIALAANPDMAAALARMEQARARVDQALAAWWPNLDLSASGTKTRLSDNAYEAREAFALLSGEPVDRTTDNFNAALKATWVLFDGFYRNYAIEQARFAEKGSTAARRDAQRLLALNVAEAFFNAQLAQTRVDIAEADRKFYASQLGDAQNRYEVGVGKWGDVLNIKVQLNSAKTSLMLGRRQFEAASYGLAALMGIPDAAFPEAMRLAELDRNIRFEADKDDPEKLIAQALAARPDIQRLRMMTEEAKAGRGRAEASRYPRVQVFGTVNGDRYGDPALGIDDFGNTIGVSLAWNLFRGGADRARVVEAGHREREAGYTLAALRNKIASEVRQDLALLAAAEEQVCLQRESVDLVRENRDLAKNEYEAGEASLVRLNEAQRDLTATHGRLAQALVSYHQARHRLLAATGQNIMAGASASGHQRK